MVANAEVGIDQGYQLLYDNKIESGMSGGILLNADGELIGLYSSKGDFIIVNSLNNIIH